MFAFLDGPELAILIIAVLVLFGGSQIPKLAKNLGKAKTEFEQGLAQGKKEAGTNDHIEETTEEKLARLAEIDRANSEKRPSEP